MKVGPGFAETIAQVANNGGLLIDSNNPEKRRIGLFDGLYFIESDGVRYRLKGLGEGPKDRRYAYLRRPAAP